MVNTKTESNTGSRVPSVTRKLTVTGKIAVGVRQEGQKEGDGAWVSQLKAQGPCYDGAGTGTDGTSLRVTTTATGSQSSRQNQQLWFSSLCPSSTCGVCCHESINNIMNK